MGSKLFLAILVLQIAQCTFGADVVTVFNINTEVAAPVLNSVYHAAASDLPATIPEAIRTSTSVGIWRFQETAAPDDDGQFDLTVAHKFDKISLKVYSTAEISVQFTDAASETETPVEVKIPVTPTPAWTDYTFDLTRAAVSTETFSLRFVFTATEGNVGVFLVDSISVTETEVVASTTEAVTTEAATTEQVVSTTEAGSSAIAPTLITFVTLAILKTFM